MSSHQVEFLRVISLLPTPHRTLLGALTQLLHRITMSQTSRMTSMALAVVIGMLTCAVCVCVCVVYVYMCVCVCCV